MTDTVEAVARAIFARARDETRWDEIPDNEKNEWRADAVAAIAAHEAALRDAGFVVVPREPSAAMIQAGCDALKDVPADDFTRASISSDPQVLAKLKQPIRWRAMIAAALGETP